jgi:hypothetical protein
MLAAALHYGYLSELNPQKLKRPNMVHTDDG